MSARQRKVNTQPLVAIVGRRGVRYGLADIPHHEMACGHLLTIGDNQAAYKRRCWKCGRGKPLDFDPSPAARGDQS